MFNNSKCNVFLITGVAATRNISQNDIVCDYHGHIITESEGRAMMEGLRDEPGYLCFSDQEIKASVWMHPI